ncbi:tyrosine-type recombinase/integrase [Pseudomonas aeruginosa]|nr:integrase arm-type DNA-binding domain-containing protein [Pseudomonas aeruginosa]EKX5071994.1 integrase arm-type DNA-binding domain-containing protein [Pseudomonas aeruginosa]HBO8059565.1 integrase arm-type DNA-binding domain-containing protein [Pseudomonas aeruginosa]HBO8066089.1 integrase arm-type DNA-binding domain-containing protein [Pseudomonas aeruginosa]HBO8072498.1 integrase arm-type DNA-binding domain-containing protein [Pseudomonas aeruginosa]
MSKLTQSFVRSVVAPGRYADGRGLFLRVGAGGGKSWILRYQVDNRRHDLGLGAYPAVSLKSARLAADTLRLGLSQGIDPLAQREAERREARQAGPVTFRVEAERYIATHRPSWKNPRHAQLWSHSLRDHVYPLLGDVPVEAVDTDLVLQVLAPIWRQIPETAFRLRNRIELVLDAAKARQLRSGENPARWRGHLDKLLPRQNRSQDSFAAMPAEQLGAFVRRLDSLDSTAARACELLIHTACRSSEICEARWSEFDLASRVWTLDATRMKGGKPHRVPLTDAALQVLEQQRGQHPSHVFPNARRSGALPGNALRRVMATLQAGDYVPHGFRSTFRTWAAETTDFPRDVCEMALAHSLGDKVEAAYHRGDLLEKRRQLMQAWSAFIEEGARLPFSLEAPAD